MPPTASSRGRFRHTAHTLHLQGQLFPPVGRYRVYADAAIPRRYAPFGRNPWTSSEFCWIR